MKFYKQRINEVIHRFYKLEDEFGQPLTEQDYLQIESYPNEFTRQVETIEDKTTLSLDDEFLSTLCELYGKYHNTYDLYLDYALGDSDYHWGLTLYGDREETDEEFEKRIKKEELKEKQRKEQAKRKKEKAKLNKEKKLQELAKQLGKTIL